ncbi:protein kinase [Streptomyces sp. NPDC002952]|uniref:serine/threonine-protein kinase n=1 Tax=Streptomyces sp. NPDC002952 TaxID=3364673 RepID=UPI00369E6C21
MTGRYRLVESIGQGGMGRVWRASDDMLDRPVAVKEMRIDGLDQEDTRTRRERTLREARATARIDHPNVVRIYDVVDEGERLWIVMELVDGRSLEQIVAADGPLTVREAARLGLGLVAALRQVHAGGVLHRDIKPGNVLVERRGHRIVLTDFGIAAMQDAKALTMVGMLVGSPDYMAPERVSGQPQGPPSDVWSLGATLCAALGGRSPFSRSTTLATLHAVLYEEPELPSSAGELRDVLAALLEKEPSVRPGLAELEEALAPLAFPVRTPGPAETVPDPGTVPGPGPAPGSATMPAPGSGPGTGTGGEPGSGPGRGSGSRAGPGPDPRPGSDPDPRLGTATRTDTETGPAPATDPAPGPWTHPDPAPGPPGHPAPKPGTDPTSRPGTDPLPEPRSHPGPGLARTSPPDHGDPHPAPEKRGTGKSQPAASTPGPAQDPAETFPPPVRAESPTRALMRPAPVQDAVPAAPTPTVVPVPVPDRPAHPEPTAPPTEPARTPAQAAPEEAPASAPAPVQAPPEKPTTPAPTPPEKVSASAEAPPEAVNASTGGLAEAPTEVRPTPGTPAPRPAPPGELPGPAQPSASRTGRRRTVLAGAAAVLAGAVTALVLTATNGPFGGHGHGALPRSSVSSVTADTGTGTGGTASATPTVEGTSRPPSLPPGAHREAGGFAWVTPEGWRRDLKTGAEVHYTSPDGAQELVAKSALARGDLMKTWRTSEQNAHQGQDYRKVRLERTTFRGRPAVVWEYTFTMKGVHWHARLLGFDADGKSYQINTWYQPDDESRALRTYEKVKDSFTIL